MPFAPEWPLETERLVLRPFTEDDFDALYEMRSDAGVSRYLYTDPHSPEQTREFLQVKIAGASASSPRTGGDARAGRASTALPAPRARPVRCDPATTRSPRPTTA